MSENRCICCGEPIPEGTQVCPQCMKEYDKYDKPVSKELRNAQRFEEIMMDWVYPILLVAAVIAFFFVILGK